MVLGQPSDKPSWEHSLPESFWSCCPTDTLHPTNERSGISECAWRSWPLLGASPSMCFHGYDDSFGMLYRNPGNPFPQSFSEKTLRKKRTIPAMKTPQEEIENLLTYSRRELEQARSFVETMDLSALSPADQLAFRQVWLEIIEMILRNKESA